MIFLGPWPSNSLLCFQGFYPIFHTTNKTTTTTIKWLLSLKESPWNLFSQISVRAQGQSYLREEARTSGQRGFDPVRTFPATLPPGARCCLRVRCPPPRGEVPGPALVL